MEGDLVCSISDRKGQNWKKLSVVAKRPKGGNRMHLQLGLLITETFFALVADFLLKMKNLSDSPVIGYQGQMIVVSLGNLNLILWFPQELNQRFHLGESFSLVQMN
jgi:hypothetical protein